MANWRNQKRLSEVPTEVEQPLCAPVRASGPLRLGDHTLHHHKALGGGCTFVFHPISLPLRGGPESGLRPPTPHPVFRVPSPRLASVISPHTPDLHGAGTTIPLLVSGMTPPEVHVQPRPAPPHLAFELSQSVDSGLSLLPNPAVHHQHPTSTSALALAYPFPSCSSEGKAEAGAAQGGVVRPRREPVLPEPSCAPCPIPQRREEQVWSHCPPRPPQLSARWVGTASHPACDSHSRP